MVHTATGLQCFEVTGEGRSVKRCGSVAGTRTDFANGEDSDLEDHGVGSFGSDTAEFESWRQGAMEDVSSAISLAQEMGKSGELRKAIEKLQAAPVDFSVLLGRSADPAVNRVREAVLEQVCSPITCDFLSQSCCDHPELAGALRGIWQMALADAEARCTADGPTLGFAATLTNLGNAFGRLGDAQRQRELLERALTIQEAEYGPHHREVAITLTNLAMAHGVVGSASFVRETSARALRIIRAEFSSPNLIASEVSLCLAGAARACQDDDDRVATALWAAGASDLLAVLSEEDAATWFAAFVARQRAFWGGAGRADVGEWLTARPW